MPDSDFVVFSKYQAIEGRVRFESYPTSFVTLYKDKNRFRENSSFHGRPSVFNISKRSSQKETIGRIYNLYNVKRSISNRFIKSSIDQDEKTKNTENPTNNTEMGPTSVTTRDPFLTGAGNAIIFKYFLYPYY